MNESLYIAATGMNTQQKSVETIANNLANVNTPAFKKGKVSFEDMVYAAREGNVAGTLQGPAWHGGGVGVFSLIKDFAPAELKKTDQPMDLAVRGEGFIEVMDGDGITAFSRGGALTVDKDGMLATADGHVLKANIHVGLDAKEIQIAADGRVLVRNGDRTELAEAGRIELVRFADMSGLTALGSGLYRPTERSGDAIYGRAGEEGMGTFAQGYSEGSNVQLIDEMVNLMAAQRAYESNVKVIQAADEMLAMSNNLRK